MTSTLDPAAMSAFYGDYATYHPNLRIRHRDTRRLVPLSLNRFQRRLYSRVVQARLDQRPFRAVCLKARQRGCSTWAQSYIASRAFVYRGIDALSIAHEDPASRKLHSMLELMYDELPEALRPAKDQRERGRILAFTHGSTITVRTAGTSESGRSFALTHLHASEVALWPDAAATLTALRQTMQPKPGTFELVESTAKGMVGNGQVFHDEWYAAVAGESGYEAIFEPWYTDAGYALPAPEGLAEELTDTERELMRRFGVTLEQVAWRRWKIGTLQTQGGERTFRQEFPTTPDEAFLVTGRPFFDAERVEAMPVEAPTRTGHWRLPGGAYIASWRIGRPVQWVDAQKPGDLAHARIWRAPHKDHQYVVAVDPAGQVEDVEADAFATIDEAEDYSVMTVVDRATREVVAQWRDRIDIGLVGFYAAIIGVIYNHAIVAVEKTGGYGQTALNVLKTLGYGPQYHGEVFDEQKRILTRKLGWNTTMITRPQILEGLVDVLREHPELLRSEWLQSEMRTMIRGRRAEAAAGHHDDVVMSTAIALEVAREHPHRVGRAA